MESDGKLSAIIFGDMTRLDQRKDILDRLLSSPAAGLEKFIEELHILGNLPFNVSTVLLTGWLRDLHEGRGLFHQARTRFKRIRLTLMFQKEVADRILASDGSADRSRLSVASQMVCRVRRLYDIPRTVFVPRPKVDATVVQLEPHSAPLYQGFSIYNNIDD